MKWQASRLVLLGLALGVPLWAGFPRAAAAQEEITRGESVQYRPRPDLDPLGIPLGSFLLFPKLNLRENYNDNIFASETDRISDFITTINPSVDLRSNWNSNSLSLHADLASAIYASNTAEDNTNYNLYGNGTIDVTRNFQLFGDAGYSQLHEDRASPDNPGGIEPTQYHLFTVTAGGRTQLDRFSLEQEMELDRYVYQNVPSTTGGIIDNTDRDHDETTTSVKVGYEIMPQRTVFMRAAYNWRRYDTVPDVNGIDRNSDGYNIVVGANYDLTGIMFAELFAGYMSQSYDDPTLPPVSGPSLGGTLIWNVTRLTTITGSLSREISETTIDDASGFISIDTSLRVDHELLRNLPVNAQIGYSNDQYEGVDRDDNYYSAGVGLEYRLNRYVSLTGGYAYRQRNSNAADSSFYENDVFVELGTHM
jgi:hypothetical protein